jgi:hypothetical protein
VGESGNLPQGVAGQRKYLLSIILHYTCDLKISFHCSEIPDDDFGHLCNLVYSACAIEQANASARLEPCDLQTLLGDIVNGKRKKDCQHDLCEIQILRRIQNRNSARQTKTAVDQRDARRVAWLKWQTQSLHYDRWEEFCVEYGFARKSESDEEKADGNLFFYDPSRIIQADEFCFTLNGIDEAAGGRPSKAFSTDEVPESGQSSHKSGEKCTVLQAINFADEAFPPFVIFPSKVKGDQVKTNPKMIKGFKQVRGKYGLKEYHWHDARIAYSKSGSINKELFMDWMLQFLIYCYPDAKDVKGKRCCLKIDSGPGKLEIQFTI